MRKLIIKTKGKTYCIDVETILYCRASSSYTCIYLASGDTVIASFNLTVMHEKLDHCDFIFRVSRSHLINLHYLSAIDHTNRVVELRNDIKIPYTGLLKEIEDSLIKLVKPWERKIS